MSPGNLNPMPPLRRATAKNDVAHFAQKWHKAEEWDNRAPDKF